MSSNTTDSSGLLADSMSKVGLGYGIAIAVGILVLVSTIMLASYVCVKLHGRGGPGGSRSSSSVAHRNRTRARAAAVDQQNIQVRVMTMQGEDQSRGASNALQPCGIDEATLETYPKIVYSEKTAAQAEAAGGGVGFGDSCSICLADYRDGETLRLLPDCRHVFHAECIDAWLRLHVTCPMCRSSPLPTPTATPISTPLSELIPLARNPLNSHYTIHNYVIS